MRYESRCSYSCARKAIRDSVNNLTFGGAGDETTKEAAAARKSTHKKVRRSDVKEIQRRIYRRARQTISIIGGRCMTLKSIRRQDGEAIGHTSRRRKDGTQVVDAASDVS